MIKKKVHNDSTQESSPSGVARSAIVEGEEECQESHLSSVVGDLEPIPESTYEDDHESGVEFDILQDGYDNQDNDFCGAVYPYPFF